MREHKKSHLGIMGWAMFLAGAMSLGSCSSDETLESIEREAITFGNVTMENLSRATDPSYSAKDIASFQVWGTVTGNAGEALIFDGATISKGNAAYGVAWTQEDGQQQYWIPGADYEFLAIVDGNKSGVTSITEKDGLGMPTTISYTADGVTDLLCQNVSRPQNSDESVVAFQFTHLLSKVHFTFESEFQNVDVTDIQITGHYESGTYNIGDKSWTLGSKNTSSISFGAALGITPAIPVTSTYARLIIPGEQTWTISFIKDGKEETPTITHNFVANTEYNILVTFEGGEITFTIHSLEQWGAEQNIPLNP